MSRVLCVLIVIYFLDSCYLVLGEDSDYSSYEKNDGDRPKMIIVSWEEGMNRKTTNRPTEPNRNPKYPEDQKREHSKEITQEITIEHYHSNSAGFDNSKASDHNDNSASSDSSNYDKTKEADSAMAPSSDYEYGYGADYGSVDIDGLSGNDYNNFEGKTAQIDEDLSIDIDGIDYGNQYQLKAHNDYPDMAPIVVLDSMDVRNYRAEIEAGNKADILGTNAHYYQPDKYPDFSRRFVPQYPYKVAKNNKIARTSNKLTPKLAPPELVLAIAKHSADLSALEPKNPKSESIRKGIQRTGDYWNAVWKEDIDPQVLRTNKLKKLKSVRAEIRPGSTLYDLVTKLKQLSPSLLYVINENQS